MNKNIDEPWINHKEKINFRPCIFSIITQSLTSLSSDKQN